MVLGTAIRTTDVEELRYYILRALSDRYADQKNITVKRAEIDRYERHVAAFAKADAAKRAARLAVIERELQDQSLPSERRSALLAEANPLRALRDSEAREAAAGTAALAQDKAARDLIATAFIRQWKINRALHRQYGGRVIFQQGGPEPLDAYRKFLEAAQKRGDFVITEKTLEAGFWRYYRDDTHHAFLPANIDAFATPPWAGRQDSSRSRIQSGERP